MARLNDTKEKLMAAVSELIWVGSYGSTTVDHICDKAGVKKGSFYHFFDSKADLAVAAIDSVWQHKRHEIDTIFSPLVPPLERLRQYCETGYRHQAQIKAQFGRVLGCPLFSLGAEISTQEIRLQKKVQEILDYTRTYLESAIRDAHAAGLIDAPDAVSRSRMLYAYYQGLITQARIENRLEVLDDAVRGTFEILGIKAAPAAA